MKKRIITNNLDWHVSPHYIKNTIIKKISDDSWVAESVLQCQYNAAHFLLDECVKRNPDWFEDVDEEKYKIYVENNNLDNSMSYFEWCGGDRNKMIKETKIIFRHYVNYLKKLENGIIKGNYLV